MRQRDLPSARKLESHKGSQMSDQELDLVEIANKARGIKKDYEDLVATLNTLVDIQHSWRNSENPFLRGMYSDMHRELGSYASSLLHLIEEVTLINAIELYERAIKSESTKYELSQLYVALGRKRLYNTVEERLASLVYVEDYVKGLMQELSDFSPEDQ